MPKLDPERQRIVDEIVKRIPDEADRAKARAELEQDFGAMTPEQVRPIKRLMDDLTSDADKAKSPKTEGSSEESDAAEESGGGGINDG